MTNSTVSFTDIKPLHTIDSLHSLLRDKLRKKNKWSGCVVVEKEHSLFRYNVLSQNIEANIDEDIKSDYFTPDVWPLRNGNYVVERDTPRITYYDKSGNIVNTLNATFGSLTELYNGNILLFNYNTLHEVHLWNPNTNQVTQTRWNGASFLQLSDSRLLVVDEYDRASLYDKNLELLDELDPQLCFKRFQPFLELTPGVVVYACDDSFRVLELETRGMKFLNEHFTKDFIVDVFVAQELVVIVTTNKFSVYDTTGKLVSQWEGSMKHFRETFFDLGDDLLAYPAPDGIEVRNIRTGELKNTFRIPSGYTHICFMN